MRIAMHVKGWVRFDVSCDSREDEKKRAKTNLQLRIQPTKHLNKGTKLINKCCKVWGFLHIRLMMVAEV